MQLSLVHADLFEHGSAERGTRRPYRIDNDASSRHLGFRRQGGRRGSRVGRSGRTRSMDSLGRRRPRSRPDPRSDGDSTPSWPPLNARRGAPERHHLFRWQVPPSPSRTRWTPSVPTPTSTRTRRSWRSARTVGKPVFANSHAFRLRPVELAIRSAGSASCPTGAGRWPSSTGRTVGCRHQGDRFRRRPRTERLGCRPRPVDAPGPGFHDQLPDQVSGPTHPCSFPSSRRAPPTIRPTSARGRVRPGFEARPQGYEGMGYVTGLDTEGSSVTVAIAVPKAGSRRLQCRVANGTGTPSL